MSKETLEEGYERIYDSMDYVGDFDFTSFKLGGKWQQERSYSEAIEFGKWLDENMQHREYYPMSAMTMEELFEQFKKG